MAWYDLSQVKKESFDSSKDEDGNLDIDDKILKRFVEKTTQVIEKVKEIGLPEKKEQLRLITTKFFNSIAIIKHIADQEKIIDAVFVIFSINQSAAKILIELKNENKLQNCKLVISSIRNSGHRSKSIAVDLLKNYFEIIFVNSHAKLAVMRTEKNNYYAVEGSGNFSYNGRLEQYVIDNDQVLYDFSKEWILELEKYKMDENNRRTN